MISYQLLREKSLSEMRKTVFKIVICFSAALLMILPSSLQAGENGQQADMPMSVRMILHNVSPMLENEEFAKAAKTLEQFLDKGGSAQKAIEAKEYEYHHPEVYFALGNCYLMQEKYTSAARAYEYSVQARPDFSSAWLNLARSFYELGQLRRAGECFEQAYERSKDKKPQYLYHSALAYLMDEKYSQAIATLERLFDTHPSVVKPEWKENMVHALMAVNKPRIALPYMQDLAQNTSGKRQRRWQETLLYQYLELGMTQKALRHGRKLTRQYPTNPKWWKGLTHINLNLGRSEEALAALMVYGFLTPLSDQEKKLIADLSLEADVPVKAVPMYTSWLQDHHDTQVLRRLVAAYRRLSQPDKALETIDSLGPKTKSSELLMLEGELLYELEKFAQAARVFEQAAGKQGSHRGRAWLMAGYAAWQSDDHSRSQKAFSQAAKFQRQKKEASKALQQIQRIIAKKENLGS